jgi:hypothetical protein
MQGREGPLDWTGGDWRWDAICYGVRRVRLSAAKSSKSGVWCKVER